VQQVAHLGPFAGIDVDAGVVWEEILKGPGPKILKVSGLLLAAPAAAGRQNQRVAIAAPHHLHLMTTLAVVLTCLHVLYWLW
jgi:hypothetical protein